MRDAFAKREGWRSGIIKRFGIKLHCEYKCRSSLLPTDNGEDKKEARAKSALIDDHDQPGRSTDPL